MLYLIILLLAEIVAKIFEPIKEGRKIKKYHELIRWGFPSIGFQNNIFAAEKTLNTLAFFSYFGKDLKLENW